MKAIYEYILFYSLIIFFYAIIQCKMASIEILYRNRDFHSLTGMRLAFVQPKYHFDDLEDSHGMNEYTSILPNFGALQLLTSVKDATSIGDVRYFERSAYTDDAQLEKDIKEFFMEGPGIIAAACYTATLDHTRQFFTRFDDSRFLKIVGGPHITAMPDISFAHIAVIGEGEETLAEIIGRFPDIGSIRRGIAYSTESGEILTPPRYNMDLDVLSLPDFRLIDNYRKRGLYRSSLGKSEGDAVVYLTSAGCRSNCSFCPSSLLHGRYRQKSSEKVISEIDELVEEYGFSEIQIYDDNFLDRIDADIIMDHLGKKGVSWICLA